MPIREIAQPRSNVSSKGLTEILGLAVLVVFGLVVTQVNTTAHLKLYNGFVNQVTTVRQQGDSSDATAVLRNINDSSILQLSSMLEFPVSEWPTIGASRCRHNFSFFVYDDLPTNFTTDLETPLLDILSSKTQNGTYHGVENMETEYALVQLFRTSPCRTYIASEANFWVVPYMSFADCSLSPGYGPGCPQVNQKKLEVLSSHLKYYNQQTQNRHVAVQLYDNYMSPKYMRRHFPLRIMTGPQETDTEIVAPLFCHSPSGQPSVMLSDKQRWTSKGRIYGFAAVYGTKLNPRMRPRNRQPRRWRQLFYDQFQARYEKSATVTSNVKNSSTFLFGDMPYILESSVPTPVNSNENPRANILDNWYRQSHICPILPGDNSWMRRVYDVIRNGCIPAIMESTITLDAGKNKTTAGWWVPHGKYAADKAFPFFQTSRDNNLNIDVDYRSFVIVAHYNSSNQDDMTPLMDEMLEVLQNPVELERRRQAMSEYAVRLFYGLGRDAHVYNDAFSQILYQLEGQLK